MTRGCLTILMLVGFAQHTHAAMSIPNRQQVPADTMASAAESPVLIIQNQTDSPIQVYADDRYIGLCESYATLRFQSAQTGKITLSGRSMCDSWGPVTRTLKPGRETTWRVSEMDRKPGPGKVMHRL